MYQDLREFAEPLTARQLAWCAEHDWFIGATTSGRARVRDVQVSMTDNGVTVSEFVWCGSFSALREWAGY